MKNFKTKILKKVLPVFLLFVLIFNFIVPNYVYADAWETVGGVLFAPVKGLICGIADAVLNLLQNTFVTKDTNIDVDGVYHIRYSPGIIFRGDIPGLDINFISPMDPQSQIHNESTLVSTGIQASDANQKKAWQKFKTELQAKLFHSDPLPSNIANINGNEDPGLKPFDKITFEYKGKSYKVNAWHMLWVEHFELMEVVDYSIIPATASMSGAIGLDEFNNHLKNVYGLTYDAIVEKEDGFYFNNKKMTKGADAGQEESLDSISWSYNGSFYTLLYKRI